MDGQTNHVYCGYPATATCYTAIAIGTSGFGYAPPPPVHCISLGPETSAKNREIEIGAKTTNWTRVEVGGVDLLALQKRVDELEEANGKLMEMIETMWYSPGMPGAPEAPDHPSFRK